MSIPLNKQQLQQTLREMRVVYPMDADEDELRKILERENDRQWLKQAYGKSFVPGARVIRKRRAPRKPADPPPPGGGTDEKPREKFAEGRRKPPAAANRSRETARKKRSPRVSEPELVLVKPVAERPNHSGEPTFDPGKDVDGYALKRANGVCDLCETRPEKDSKGKPAELTAYYFGEAKGGEARSIKTVAALCPACLALVSEAPRPADIKKLTRKARGKLISGVAVYTRRRPTKRESPKKK